MSKWRVISTAPKDATDILVARFDEDGSYWVAVAQWWVMGFFFMYGEGRGKNLPVQLAFIPTHWQPLPAALGEPEIGESGE